MISQQNFQKCCPTWEDFPDIELYMDQVISVLERYLAPFSREEKLITSTMINNYVKQRILPPPQNKRYRRDHLALLFVICVWKRFLPLSRIATLLSELMEKRSVEETWLLFSRALTAAFSEGVVQKSGDEAEKAVCDACLAFARICAAEDALTVLEQKARRREELTQRRRESEKKKKDEKKKEEKKKDEKKDEKKKK